MVFLPEVVLLFLLFIRTLLVYAAVIGGLRFTGKRQLGELSTSEFAVTILVSELAFDAAPQPQSTFLSRSRKSVWD